MKRTRKRARGARRGEVPVFESVAEIQRLRPRHHQTLDLLLLDHDEHRIARKLGLARNTARGYVKTVYRRFGVNSRAELRALWTLG